jgi:hypothetical protein
MGFAAFRIVFDMEDRLPCGELISLRLTFEQSARSHRPLNFAQGTAVRDQ